MTKSDGDSEVPHGIDIELTRRHLFKASAPAIGAMASASAPRSIAVRPTGRIASVTDFGAKGDGIADDSAAFKAALAAAQIIEVPVGTFRIDAPIVIGDGQIVRGAGRSGWEPYTGTGPPQSPVRTEIVVNGRLAFDARNTNNAAVTGLAIRAQGGAQSRWAFPPGVQTGAVGIDIAGSLQFDASDISFHGLETAISSVADKGRTTHMPRLDNWVAHDCGAVIRFISNDESFHAVRDAQITGCLAALHCAQIVAARNCDGIRIENARFYQCVANSLLIEGTSFVAIVGVTLFETGKETIVLRDCRYVTMAGLQVVRAGFYHGGPLVQQSAMVFEKCHDLSFDGIIEQPVGRAITILDSINLSIKGAIGTPYWSTGNLASEDGAIRIERSRSVVIDASFSGTSYWVAVWADAASGPSISGRIATEGSAGVVRCVQLLSPPWGHILRTSTPISLAPNGSVKLDELRILVPPGKSLVSRSVELTSPGLTVESAGQKWRMNDIAEPGGGTLSIERKLLHRNDTTEARYASVPVSVNNITAKTIDVPAGHETRISLAVE